MPFLMLQKTSFTTKDTKMKILLLGEYSNVHATLATGLRALGHEVVVASNGDYWKDYPRDIDLARREGPLAGVEMWLKIMSRMRNFQGYDIVQIINPMFFELKAERIFPLFRFLARNNKKVVLGAFGMDYYWVKRSDECIFRYGDFNIGSELRYCKEAMEARREWLGTPKEELSKFCANTCDHIVTGLYEYDAVYRPLFPDKTTFIPFPILTADACITHQPTSRVKVFVGISRGRSAYKGTDIMLRAAEEVAKRYPQRMELIVAEGLPFSEYCEKMKDSDAILDQLYSYTPAMNALEAMSHGIICVGGGEPENYEIINESELRPIVNVLPDYESVVEQLTRLVLSDTSEILRMKQESVEYVKRHHDALKVARQYESLYAVLLAKP